MMNEVDISARLEELAAEIGQCQRCPLGGLRTRAVPGEGPITSEIMFIGEGPGYHEDRQGRPFVGASGQFLQSLLASIDLRREQVYITNIIKCRPPNNRDPLPEEIEACARYLDEQIALINPLVIVTLGRYSMARFFPPTVRITKVRGQPLRLEDRIVLPMFHPAAALRNPDWQQAMYEDIAKIPTLLVEARAVRLAHTQEIPADDLEQLSFF